MKILRVTAILTSKTLKLRPRSHLAYEEGGVRAIFKIYFAFSGRNPCPIHPKKNLVVRKCEKFTQKKIQVEKIWKSGRKIKKTVKNQQNLAKSSKISARGVYPPPRRGPRWRSNSWLIWLNFFSGNRGIP